eukprot:451203_1
MDERIVVVETYSNLTWVVITSVTFIPNLALLMYHIYKTLNKSLSKSLLQILTISIILSQIIWCFVLILFVSYPYYKFPIPCVWRDIITMWLCRVIPKTLIYWLLIERLFVIFNDSIYGYSQTKRTTIRLSYLFYTMFCWGLAGSQLESHPQDNGKCSPGTISAWVGLLAGVTDLWISILILVIFSRKVWSINLVKIHSELGEISVTSPNNVELSQSSIARNRSTSTSSVSGNNKLRKFDFALLQVFRKITLLSMITIISSLIGSLFGFYVMIFDNFFNAVCVVLMFNVHEKFYQQLCGKCKISDRCLLCCSCSCCCKIVHVSSGVNDKQNGNEKSNENNNDQNNDQKI